MEQRLTDMHCSTLRENEPPLAGEELETYLTELPEWDLIEEDGTEKLRRVFDFNNFVEALDFTNRVGQVAEKEGHHPIITLTWGRATVTWYTHKIKGLHKNDFIMAAKTDERYVSG